MTKKLSTQTLLLYVIMIGALILVLIYVVIPYGMNLRRRINIKKDMESVYTDAEFVSVKCDTKPTDRLELEGSYLWFDVEIPEDDLYAFQISDSEGDTEIGYKKAGAIGYYSYGSRGYPGLWLFLDDKSDETLDAIEGLLTDADFDMFVQFIYAINDISGADGLSDISPGGYIGRYHPCAKSDEDVILGK